MYTKWSYPWNDCSVPVAHCFMYHANAIDFSHYYLYDLNSPFNFPTKSVLFRFADRFPILILGGAKQKTENESETEIRMQIQSHYTLFGQFGLALLHEE